MPTHKPSSKPNAEPHNNMKLDTTPKGLKLTAIPPHPEDFGEEGASRWMYYCGIYLKYNNLSMAWLPCIENVCRLHEYIAIIQTTLDTQGTMIIKWIPEIVAGKETGEVKPRSECNPLFRDYLKACNQLHNMLTDMGCTPYSAKVASLGGGNAADLAPTQAKPKVARPEAPKLPPETPV